MARQFFYYSVIRKIIIGFMDIFNDIVIARYNTSGVKLKEVIVPINIGPKSKSYQYLKEQGRNEEMLPMISVIMSGIDFDVTRMTNRHQSIKIANDDVTKKQTLAKNMVPYNFGFNLTIWALHMVDIDQIYEQILPYFTPHAFIKIHIPELGMYLEIKVVLTSCSPIMTDQESEEEARVLKWDNAFVCQGYLFTPSTEVGTIEKENIRLFINEDTWADRNTETVITSGAGSPAVETLYLEGIEISPEAEILYNYEIFPSH